MYETRGEERKGGVTAVGGRGQRRKGVRGGSKKKKKRRRPWLVQFRVGLFNLRRTVRWL